MKNVIIKTILLTIVMITVSLLLIYILTLPAIWSEFDLSNSSNIGGTIGGITSPLLGIISVVFLYLTLNKQIDNTNDQKLKNESDIIFMLFNQLNNEYNQIYLYTNNKNERIKKTGHEALTEYCNSVFKFYNAKGKNWSKYYNSDNIILVIRSYKLIEKRIELSSLENELKLMFKNKLNTFFMCKLQDPLYKLTELFKREKSLQDEYTEEVNSFYETQTIKN
jgi:hypothetical protein